MLDAAFYGSVFKDASEVKESKAGNRYATAIIAVSDGQDEEGRDRSQFIKVIAFAEFAAELGKNSNGATGATVRASCNAGLVLR